MTIFDKSLILARNPWLTAVTVLPETISTQNDAKQAKQINTLFLTDRQTATYGRFGRAYFAAQEGGIYMSVNLGTTQSEIRPLRQFERQSETPSESPIQYTLLAAAAVASAIERLTDKKPQIKWVNDIYLGGKKIVGILAESGASGIILGMGINFQIRNFPEELTTRATSLFFDEAATISPSELIAEIWAEFDRLKSTDFRAFYKAHCFILGQNVAFRQNKLDYSGLATDLTEHGELVVDCTDGRRRLLNSGEISLKK